MLVIFQKDVPRVGKKGDVKEVSDGYVVNFLLPRRLAIVATPQALREFEKQKQSISIHKEIQEDLLLRSLEEIKGKTVTLQEKADPKGHLFAAVHKKEIVEAMRKEHHAEISEESIVLERPLKQTGEFEIPISIKDKKSFFKLNIEAK